MYPCAYKSVWLRFNNLYQFAFRSLIINFYFFLAPLPRAQSVVRTAFLPPLPRSACDKFPPSPRRPSSIYSRTFSGEYSTLGRAPSITPRHHRLILYVFLLYVHHIYIYIYTARSGGGVCVCVRLINLINSHSVFRRHSSLPSSATIARIHKT